MRYKYNHNKQITKQNINKYQKQQNPYFTGLYIIYYLFVIWLFWLVTFQHKTY